MRGLGLNLTNPVRTGGVWDVCLCLGYSCVGGVCVALDPRSGWMAWCYVCVCSESGLFV